MAYKNLMAMTYNNPYVVRIILHYNPMRADNKDTLTGGIIYKTKAWDSGCQKAINMGLHISGEAVELTHYWVQMIESPTNVLLQQWLGMTHKDC